MFARILATTAVALAAGVPVCALAESFNAKTGAWEMTVTTTTTGNPLSPSMLADMPPEKRAKVEQAMKERDGKPITTSYKTCITQKELDQDHFINSEDNVQCTKKVLTKSATKLVLDQTCPPPHASTGRATIEAKTPERLLGTIDTVQGGATGKAHVEIRGKWLAASCEGVDK